MTQLGIGDRAVTRADALVGKTVAVAFEYDNGQIVVRFTDGSWACFAAGLCWAIPASVAFDLGLIDEATLRAAVAGERQEKLRSLLAQKQRIEREIRDIVNDEAWGGER